METREAAPDIAVIGGGIVGVSTAAFLAEAGLTVRLYERTAVAAGASGRNSGIVQQPRDRVLAELYFATLREYRRLTAADDGPFAFPADPAGMLLIGRDSDAATRTAADWTAAWPAAGAEVLEGASLTRLEPALAPDLVACRLGIGYPIAPAAATQAYEAAARRAGVELVIGSNARPAFDGERVIGVERDGTMEPAGAVVVAAGPWVPDVIDPSGAWRPIRSVWGVVAAVALEGGPRHALEALDTDIEPMANGAAIGAAGPHDDLVDFSLIPAMGSSALGSTFLPTEPDPAAWLPTLLRVGERYVPRVAGAPLIGMRHCARPVSQDGRPLVGPAPWCAGLWVAAGHGPWGISTGPGTARLLVDRILGRIDDAAIPRALAVGRFGVPGQRQESESVR